MSASSDFFRNLLKQTNDPHHFIYMEWIKVKYLKYVVDFIYFREVNVYQEDLNDFLEIAEQLQLNGITKDTNSKFNSSQPTNNQPNYQHFKFIMSL